MHPRPIDLLGVEEDAAQLPTQNTNIRKMLSSERNGPYVHGVLLISDFCRMVNVNMINRVLIDVRSCMITYQ